MRKVLGFLTLVVIAASFVLAGCNVGFPTTSPPTGKNAPYGLTPKAAFNGPAKAQYTFPEVIVNDAQEETSEVP